MPFRPNAQYEIMLSNTDVDNETTYSIGIDCSNASETEMQSFNDTSLYEPNDNEQTAHTIAIGNNIVSYLHKGDLDYYIIDMSDPNETMEPTVIDYEDHAVREQSGNGDDIVNYGETHWMDIKLINSGSRGTDGLSVTLSTEDIYTTIDNDSPTSSTTYGRIDGSSSSWARSTTTEFYYGYSDSYCFRFTIDNSCPADHVVTFNISMTDDYGNNYDDSFTITVRSP